MPAADHCRLSDGCITCGDVAVALTVMDVAGGDAHCRDDAGRSELVATDLVGVVAPGDRLLVHAGVAIGRLDRGCLDVGSLDGERPGGDRLDGEPGKPTEEG